MASGWMKSLQCKSKAVDDVVHSNRTNHHHHQRSLSQSTSCKNSVRNLKDIVVETTKNKKPKPPFKRPVSTIRTWSSSAQSLFPSLTELPEGHPSRNVVEIIFHTSWGDKSFSGRVEMVFKVHNLSRTVTRFEEYRELVKTCAVRGESVEDQERCVADGNEVMKFFCLGDGDGAWGLYGGRGSGGGVCMYSGSGVAHEKAGGGGGRGRKAMLVCRVIAGRIGSDSVGRGTGELLLFDSRAFLPCFLIIYCY